MGRALVMIVPRWAAVAILGATGGGAAAALIQYGRTSLFGMGLKWAALAALVAACLASLYLVQSALVALAGGGGFMAGLRRAAWSFAPLVLLWPMVLLVELWDSANHVFVFYPAVGLYWGSLAFVFAVWQVGLVAAVADGGPGWLWDGATRSLKAVRGATLDGPTAFPLILAAYTLMRLTVLFAFETAPRVDPGPAFDGSYILATLSDQGVYPYLSRWSEYPPLWPWLSTGVYKAVSFFGVTYERYFVAITLALLPFGVGNLILVYRLADLSWDRRKALNAAWAYTALAIPMYEWMRTFDSIAVFFLLLAVYLGIRGRRYTATLAAVVGFLVKVVPLSAGVMIVRYAGTFRERLGLVVAGGIFAALGLLPFWIFGQPWFEASIANMVGRPAWETPWALLDGNYQHWGWVNPYRLHPPFATAYDYSGRLPNWFWALPPLGLLATYAYLALMRRPGEDPLTQVRLAFVCLIAMALALKGWSPQFIVWFLPFFIIVYPNGGGLILAAAVGAIDVFWRPLGIEVGNPRWLIQVVVSARAALFLLLALLLLRQIRASGRIGEFKEAGARLRNG